MQRGNETMSTPAPTPIETFRAAGLTEAQAAELQRQEQALTGSHTDAAPASAPPAAAPASPRTPAYTPQSRPTPPHVAAAIKERAAEIVKQTGCDPATAASVASQEMAYQAATGSERSAMLSETEARHLEHQVNGAIDLAMEPPSSPHAYTFPTSPSNPEEAASENRYREALFQAGFPVHLGNLVAQGVEQTAKELRAAIEAGQADAVMARYEEQLRERWGSSYDSRLALAREFIREQGRYSPALRELADAHPELLAHPDTVERIATLAESRKRTAWLP
jgi:hypothetical protein